MFPKLSSLAACAALLAPLGASAQALEPPPCENPNPQCLDGVEAWVDSCPQRICPNDPIVVRVECRPKGDRIYCEADPFEMDPAGRLEYHWTVESAEDTAFPDEPAVVFACERHPAVVHLTVVNGGYSASTTQKVNCE
jgi:hypothetical protein